MHYLTFDNSFLLFMVLAKLPETKAPEKSTIENVAFTNMSQLIENALNLLNFKVNEKCAICILDNTITTN